jgi:hypothetical protein
MQLKKINTYFKNQVEMKQYENVMKYPNKEYSDLDYYNILILENKYKNNYH